MLIATIAVIAAALAILYFISSDARAAPKIVVDVVGALDGRTVEVVLEGKNARVVLAGIGFPGGDRKSECDCFEAVKEMAVGRRLYMQTHKEVENLKYVALQSANGDSVNGLLLSRGLARYESAGAGYIAELIAAEHTARNLGIGIWDPNRALFKHMNGSGGPAEDLFQNASLDERED